MKRFLLIIVILGGGIGLFLWLKNTPLINREPLRTEVEIPTKSGITPTMDLVNDVWSHKTVWSDVMTEKTQEAKVNPEALKELAFAQSFTGDMKSAEATLDTYCQNKPDDGACRKIEYSFDIQKPVDNNGILLSGLTFEILGKPASAQKIAKAGPIADMMYKNTVLRTKISKKGYTDFVTKAMHTTWGDDTASRKDVVINPVLIPANVDVTKKNSETYEIKTKNYTFTIQPDSFVYPDGSPVEGDVGIYFFDITADTKNAYASGMFSLDVFDSFTGTNMGEGMETYGMPLVKAYKGDIELYMKKPIIGVGRMSNLEDFKTKNAIKEIDFAAIPKNTPIDYTRAMQYGLPPFWQYKKRTGTWEMSSFELLDSTGLTRFSFSDF